MKFDSLETEELEYIKSARKFKKAAISLCAMLNAHGHGVVYLGVRDDGLAIGRDIGDEDGERALEVLQSRLKPEVQAEASVMHGGDESYIRIEARGTDRPYSAYDRYYIRYGTEDRVMTQAQMKSLALSSASDLLTGLPAKRQNLEFSQLKSLCRSRLSRDEMLDDVATLQTADGRYNMLAYMLSDDPDLHIRIFRHDKADPEYSFLWKVCGGECMLSAMKEAEECVLSLCASADGAKKDPLFDVQAFKAAWQNAFLHNAWHTGAAPRIEIYGDKMEIVSEGGLAEGMSDKDLFSGERRPANPELEAVMEKLGLIEKDGHRLSLVTGLYGEDAVKVTDNRLVVTISFAYSCFGAEKSETSSGEKSVTSSGEKSVTSSGEKSETSSGAENKRIPLSDRIVALMEENPYITADQMSVRCKVSKSTVSNTLAKMTRDGIIVREGSKKTGKWKVL